MMGKCCVTFLRLAARAGKVASTNIGGTGGYIVLIIIFGALSG